MNLMTGRGAWLVRECAAPCLQNDHASGSSSSSSSSSNNGVGNGQRFALNRRCSQGGRATTLLTRRTWRPHEAAGSGGADMIQIGGEGAP